MPMRNKIGKAFIVFGCLFIIAAFTIAVYNVYEDYIVGTALEDITEELDDNTFSEKNDFYLYYPDMQMPVISIDGIDYIGKLEINSIDLSLPIISEWNYDNLHIAPCRYEGSVYNNDAVIAGHNYSAHFRNLSKLSVGDKVTFTDVNGNDFEYKVAEFEVLQPANIQEMIEGEWDLTLFTCTIGGRTRFTVRCVSVDK